MRKKIPKFLKTQNAVNFETHIRRNQKVNKNESEDLEIKSHPKQKNFSEKPEIDVACSNCEQRSWIEFDKSFNCENFKVIVMNINIR